MQERVLLQLPVHSTTAPWCAGLGWFGFGEPRALQKAGGRRWVGEARGAFQELNQIQREEQEELKPWEG